MDSSTGSKGRALALAMIPALGFSLSATACNDQAPEEQKSGSSALIEACPVTCGCHWRDSCTPPYTFCGHSYPDDGPCDDMTPGPDGRAHPPKPEDKKPDATFDGLLTAMEAQVGVLAMGAQGLNTQSSRPPLRLQGFNPVAFFSELRGHACEQAANVASIPLGKNVYYAQGISVAQSFGLAAATGSYDIVYDLTRKETASFLTAQSVLGITSPGAAVGSYLAYAFGDKNGVIDAWSGPFLGGTVALGFGKLLNGSVNAFASPDGSITGGGVGAAVGFGAPLPLEGGGTIALAGAADAATQLRSHALRGTIQVNPAYPGGQNHYVAFAPIPLPGIGPNGQKAASMAFAMALELGPLAYNAAGFALALGLLQDGSNEMKKCM
jgi:hypothetical protein